MRPLLRAFLLLATTSLFAQSNIRYLADRKAFVLDSGTVTYAFGINERAELQHLYWGARLTRDADIPAAHIRPEWSSFDLTEAVTPQEYPGYGSEGVNEHALKITFPDGLRNVVLHYLSHAINGNTLTITTKDIERNLTVDLRYTVYPDTGIIGRSSLITNHTPTPIVVESAQSAQWHLPDSTNYTLTSLSGRWAGEWQVTQELLTPGQKILESRRGATGHQSNPWFALQQGPTSETDGRTWFGALAWSGSWRFDIEQTPHHQVRVTGGFNTFDFAYPLQPNESLETPVFFAGFTKHGLGEASRLLHRFTNTQILPTSSRSKPRPVLYNSWEATTFDVSEEGQIALAKKAATLGVELFVMDDGWFGARNNDHAGLGDWTPNPKKFPHGLKPLVDAVRATGMDFGIWVEPEMINADSDLYRAHPDWVINFPGRPRTEGRNQMVLNMARPDVAAHIYQVLDNLLATSGARYLKWDHNRNFSEPGWDAVPPAEQRKIWVAFTRNVYDIIDRLRAKYPTLEIESCSGGGGRVDLGILQRTDEVWPSDNTDAFDRIFIQEGFSYAYPAKIMMAWVTDVPNFNGRTTPLDFRFLTAMMGSLGIGSNLTKMSDADLTIARNWIAWYKTVRTTIQLGDQYRLASPRHGDLTAVQYISRDRNQIVAFALRTGQHYGYPAAPIHLQDLDPNATYRIKPANNKLADKITEASGSWLMEHGLHFNLTGDYDATAIVLERVK